MAETKKKIPFCPLLSAGSDEMKVCTQENCAWYMHSTKTCAMFVVAHRNIMDIKEKQRG